MAKKKKSIGAMLAELRWKKMSNDEKKAAGRKLTDARLAKRASLPQPAALGAKVADDDGAADS